MLEIAGGIILAVIVIVFWRFFLTVGLVVLGVALVFFLSLLAKGM